MIDKQVEKSKRLFDLFQRLYRGLERSSREWPCQSRPWFWRLLGTSSGRSELAFLICRMETGTMMMVLRWWHRRVPVRTRGYSQKTGSQEGQPRWPLLAPNEISRVHFYFHLLLFKQTSQASQATERCSVTTLPEMQSSVLTRGDTYACTLRLHMSLQCTLECGPCPSAWSLTHEQWAVLIGLRVLLIAQKRKTWSLGRGTGGTKGSWKEVVDR